MSDLSDFLDASPTAFHAAETISSDLISAGWTRLDERDSWSLESGRGYFIVRGERSVAAFVPGSGAIADTGLHILASHLDSPLWKLKVEAASRVFDAWRLPVEAYGVLNNRSWLDRDLEIAGYVRYEDGKGNVCGRSWRSGDAVAVIPSLAIHFDRDVNKGVELNNQQHMAALMPLQEGESGIEEYNPLLAMAAEGVGCDVSRLLAAELFLVPADKASVTGSGNGAWICSGRLDNLAMAHAMLASLPEPAEPRERGIVAIWFDAEEIGSRTESGAASLFPDELIERLVIAAGGDREALLRTRRNSFLVSADMAHAAHPNYPDRHDTGYPVVMGGGPVIKSHGRRNYATDVDTESRVAAYAIKGEISLQKMIFPSDISCGMSLGPLASAMASVPAADIGNPLWAMHSSREIASLSDHKEMIRLMQEHWKA